MYLQLWCDGESIRGVTQINWIRLSTYRSAHRKPFIKIKSSILSKNKSPFYSNTILHLDPNCSWIHKRKKKKIQNQNNNHVFYDRSIFHKLVSFIDDKNPLYPFLNKSVQRSSVNRFHGFRDKFHRSNQRTKCSKRGTMRYGGCSRHGALRTEHLSTVVARDRSVEGKRVGFACGKTWRMLCERKIEVKKKGGIFLWVIL